MVSNYYNQTRILQDLVWDHFLERPLATNCSVEALNQYFSDRFDVFSSAIDLKKTPGSVKWKLCAGKIDSAPTNAPKS